MPECCDVHPVHARQRRTLHVVLWINAVMFVAELAAVGGVMLAALGVGVTGSAWPDTASASRLPRCSAPATMASPTD